MSKSVEKSFLEPAVWVNIGAASIVHLTDSDQKISDKLSEENPLFGSQEDAKYYSDRARWATGFVMNTTALVTKEDPKRGFFEAKAIRITADNLTNAAAAGSNSWLQNAFDRERPDGNRGSMPSGHSARAFSSAFLAHKNIQHTDYNAFVRWGTSTTAYSFAYLTGYARIEGKKHYPTDVLMGAAYGSLITAFIYYMTKDFGLNPDFDATMMLLPNASSLSLNYRF